MNTSESDSTIEPTLEGVISKALPVIESALANRGIPVKNRQWQATNLVVDRVIVNFKGEDKSNFLNSYGFGFIFRIVSSWYQLIYGEGSLRHRKNTITGLAKIRHELYVLRIPIPIRISDDAQGNMRLKFPDHLEPDENAFTYIDDPPPFKHFTATEQKQIEQDILKTGSRIRRIWLGHSLLNGPSVEIKKLCDALITELNQAPAHIAPFTTRGLGHFLLSMRLCCELSIKLLVIQQCNTFDRVHNFNKLCSRVSTDDSLAFKNGIPDELWDYGALCEARYGKKIITSVTEAFRLYQRTTEFLMSFSSRYSRSGTMNGAIISLKTPVWLDATYQFDINDSSKLIDSQISP